jgi:hypothetical protein
MADEEGGVQVVLTPVQLAAILEGYTVGEEATNTNRLWGGLTVVGGAIELVGSAALLLTPEPTMVTKVGGAALAVHGSDTVSTGLVQVWTGRPQTTLTAQAAAAAARSLGCDPDTAGKVGMGVDIAVPLVAGFAGFARVLSVRSGVAMLEESEATQGIRSTGHTIAEHVGKTEAELQARLIRQPRIPAASTFRTVEQAGVVVSKGIKANALAIKQWAQAARVGARLPLTYDAGEVIGEGVVRATGQLTKMSKVRIVLEKVQDAKKIYFVLTSYPVP